MRKTSLSSRSSGTSTWPMEVSAHVSLLFASRTTERCRTPMSMATVGYLGRSPPARRAPLPGLSQSGSLMSFRSKFSRLPDKGHLVDLAQRGHAVEHLLHRRLPQEQHPFFLGHALDLGRRLAGQDQLADVVRQVE